MKFSILRRQLLAQLENHFNPDRLPTVQVDGKPFYLDRRLREIRAVNNPHHRITLTQEEVKAFPDGASIHCLK